MLQELYLKKKIIQQKIMNANNLKQMNSSLDELFVVSEAIDNKRIMLLKEISKRYKEEIE